MNPPPQPAPSFSTEHLQGRSGEQEPGRARHCVHHLRSFSGGVMVGTSKKGKDRQKAVIYIIYIIDYIRHIQNLSTIFWMIQLPNKRIPETSDHYCFFQFTSDGNTFTNVRWLIHCQAHLAHLAALILDMMRLEQRVHVVDVIAGHVNLWYPFIILFLNAWQTSRQQV